MKLSTGSKASLLLAVVLFLYLFSAHHQQSAILAIEAAPRQATHEAYLLPNPTSLRAMSLGHHEMMADLIWIRALSYFAVHFSVDRDYRWLDRYIETVIELDPNFRKIYEWAGVATIYGGVEITNEAVLVSNRFLEMGLDRYPDDWRMNFMLGCNYRFELHPANDEDAAEWAERGALHLDRAAQATGAPAWLAMSASRMYERMGASGDATTLERQAFLGPRGIVSGTASGERALTVNVPNHTISELRTVLSAGIRLRRSQSDLDWWRTLQYRRMMLLDLDSDVGFVDWDLRVLAFGDPALRVDTLEQTSIDRVFYPTLSALRGVE